MLISNSSEVYAISCPADSFTTRTQQAVLMQL